MNVNILQLFAYTWVARASIVLHLWVTETVYWKDRFVDGNEMFNYEYRD
jgi:hypothetical protein